MEVYLLTFKKKKSVFINTKKATILLFLKMVLQLLLINIVEI